MDLREYAEQRLEGIPGVERTQYTRAINAVHRVFPTVGSVRRATDRELRKGAHYGGLGESGLSYLRELVGQ